MFYITITLVKYSNNSKERTTVYRNNIKNSYKSKRTYSLDMKQLLGKNKLNKYPQNPNKITQTHTLCDIVNYTLDYFTAIRVLRVDDMLHNGLSCVINM